MADLLLELLSEEIPARMQVNAASQLRTAIEKGLSDARLTWTSIELFSTPRRLAVLVKELPLEQPDQTTERKGPKVSAPDKAIDGFCASAGISREDLDVRTVGKDDVYFAVTTQQGVPTLSALKGIAEQAIDAIHWPKSMRWADYSQTWVRPLRNILCVLDEDVVDVSWGHLSANNQTIGHRFMSDGIHTITAPAKYEEILKAEHVIANRETRKKLIIDQAHHLAQSESLTLKEDEGLLEEVTGLVEYPVAIMGKIDAAYLDLPPEVLVLEMRHHQKYFALTREDGSIAPYFITVANVAAHDNGSHIRAGNERVLRARLDDGVFYWDQDRKKSLDDWNHGLDSMIFHKKLGTVADKVSRITPLATFLAVFVPHANLTQVERAAALSKADLTTGMVGEFPELQGVMGRYYALEQQEEEAVADAIRDHYKPIGASDAVPQKAASVAVALADKYDTLAALFAVGEVPTGSKDPFALRRNALGIIRIIREHQLRLPLLAAIDKALSPLKTLPLGGKEKLNREAVRAQLLQFFIDRLKVTLKDEKLRYDVIDAACGNDDDIVRIIAKAQALQTLLEGEHGANIMAAYKRASNILKKEEQQDGISYDGSYTRSLLVQDEEKKLAEALYHLKSPVDKALKEEDYSAAMSHLASLRALLDAFFDHVTVNAEDANTRINRLHLLATLRKRLHQVADFSAIEG